MTYIETNAVTNGMPAFAAGKSEAVEVSAGAFLEQLELVMAEDEPEEEQTAAAGEELEAETKKGSEEEPEIPFGVLFQLPQQMQILKAHPDKTFSKTMAAAESERIVLGQMPEPNAESAYVQAVGSPDSGVSNKEETITHVFDSSGGNEFIETAVAEQDILSDSFAVPEQKALENHTKSATVSTEEPNKLEQIKVENRSPESTVLESAEHKQNTKFDIETVESSSPIKAETAVLPIEAESSAEAVQPKQEKVEHPDITKPMTSIQENKTPSDFVLSQAEANLPVLESSEEPRESKEIEAVSQPSEFSALIKPFNPVQKPSEQVRVIQQENLMPEMENVVLEQFQLIEKAGEVTSRIQLMPESLGKMDLQLEMKDNVLQAKLLVEQPETKQLVDQQLAALTTKLANQNIFIQEFQVVVSHTVQQSLSFNNGGQYQEGNHPEQQQGKMNRRLQEKKSKEKSYSKTNTSAQGLSLWV